MKTLKELENTPLDDLWYDFLDAPDCTWHGDFHCKEAENLFQEWLDKKKVERIEFMEGYHEFIKSKGGAKLP